jgi:hypothetical protein
MNELLCTVCGRKYSEGTSAWALKMLRLGKKLVHANWPGAIFSLPKGGMIQIDGIDAIGMSFWYDYFAIKYCDAWSIYPEPRPETAKEPEIVAHKQHANCLVCGKVIEGLLDGHATVSIKRYSISSLYESTYSHYCGKCFLELGFDATERELRNRQQPIAEPAKEQFEAGDWAKYDIDSYLRVIETPGRERTLCKTLSGVIVYPYTSCLTKVSPSDVVIHIGCLSGTVRQCGDKEEEVFALRTKINAAIIPVAMLDAPTRELVESLLKAQEGAE